MAKYSVVARDESYESEAAWAFNNSSPDKPSMVHYLSVLFGCALEFFGSWIPPEGVKYFTGKKGIFFVCLFASEGKTDRIKIVPVESEGWNNSHDSRSQTDQNGKWLKCFRAANHALCQMTFTSTRQTIKK